VTIADVMDDTADCVRFIKSGKLAAQIGGEGSIHSDHYILSGSSAGGWAALLVGLRLGAKYQDLPTPLAVLAIYPITTVSSSRAPYFHKPLKPLPWAYKADAKVGDDVPVDPLHEYLDKSTPTMREAHPMEFASRATLYAYTRQEGTYPQTVLGGLSEADYCLPSLIGKKLDSISSNDPLPGLVYIAYGDADVHVENDQSEQVVEAFQRGKASPLKVEVHVEPGKPHIWEIVDPSADIPAMWTSLASFLPS
jgi:acetyl esterase/lipase